MGYVVIQNEDGTQEFLGDEHDYETYKRDRGLPHRRLDGSRVTGRELGEIDKFGE